MTPDWCEMHISVLIGKLTVSSQEGIKARFRNTSFLLTLVTKPVYPFLDECVKYCEIVNISLVGSSPDVGINRLYSGILDLSSCPIHMCKLHTFLNPHGECAHTSHSSQVHNVGNPGKNTRCSDSIMFPHRRAPRGRRETGEGGTVNWYDPVQQKK